MVLLFLIFTVFVKLTAPGNWRNLNAWLLLFFMLACEIILKIVLPCHSFSHYHSLIYKFGNSNSTGHRTKAEHFKWSFFNDGYNPSSRILKVHLFKYVSHKNGNSKNNSIIHLPMEYHHWIVSAVHFPQCWAWGAFLGGKG